MNKPNYSAMNEKQYTARINTPAKNPAYFERFHRPLIDRAKAANPEGKVVAVDVACGHAQELDFLKNEKRVFKLGVDIADSVLLSAKTRLPKTSFMKADVRKGLPIVDNSADVGIALNAVVYVPDKILEALFRALKPLAQCAVNFRVYGNPFNRPFYKHYLQRGGKLTEKNLVVRTKSKRERFRLVGLDYRGCDDPVIRNLMVQSYFRSTRDIERLIRIVGFEMVSRDKFHFQSPINPDNEVEVYTLQKPAS